MKLMPAISTAITALKGSLIKTPISPATAICPGPRPATVRPSITTASANVIPVATTLRLATRRPSLAANRCVSSAEMTGRAGTKAMSWFMNYITSHLEKAPKPHRLLQRLRAYRPHGAEYFFRTTRLLLRNTSRRFTKAISSPSRRSRSLLELFRPYHRHVGDRQRQEMTHAPQVFQAGEHRAQFDRRNDHVHNDVGVDIQHARLLAGGTCAVSAKHCVPPRAALLDELDEAVLQHIGGTHRDLFLWMQPMHNVPPS